MKKLLVVCGPTATGKTDLGIYLSKRFGGEIISADSRQIYKGLDFLTGKGAHDSKVKVWLQDAVEPSESFSVSQWRKMFWDAIQQIWKEGKLPIVVGLTGLYLSSITQNFETIDIPPSENLRKDLEGKTVFDLGEILKKKDPYRFDNMNFSDRLNPRRLIRAIEVAEYKARNPKNQTAVRDGKLDFLFVGLIAPMGFIYTRVDEGVNMRVTGALEETRKLLEQNILPSQPALQTHGYKNLSAYLTGEMLIEEAIQRWKNGEHQDVRKQFTMLKKDKRIRWFDISSERWRSEVEKRVQDWYNRNANINLIF